MAMNTVEIGNDTSSRAPIRELSMHVEGMTCTSCVSRVEKALRKVDGVLDANTRPATESARVKMIAGTGSGAPVRAVPAAGYARPR